MGWFDKLLGRSRSPSAEDAFGQALAEALEKAGVPGPVVFDPETFEIKLGEDRTVYLTNYFREYLSEESGLDRVLEKIKATMDPENTLPDTFEDARSGLIPIIREKIQFDVSGGNAYGQGSPSNTIPYKSLNRDLEVAVAWNGRDILLTQTVAAYEMLGTNFEAAYAAAMENLKDWSFEPFVEDEPGVMVLDDSSGFATSALLRPEVLQTAGISGTPVLMMPGRNTLLLADSEDEDGLRHMAEMAEDIIADQPHLTGFSFVPDGDGWRRFPRNDERTIEELQKLNMDWLAHLYNDQKDQLETAQEKILDDENFDLMEKDWLFALPVSVTLVEAGDRICSACPWGRDSELLLPKTDYVFFMDYEDEDANGCIVAWPEVQRAFAHLMTPVGLNPERYYVTEYPEKEDLERIKTEFTWPQE